MNSLEVSPNLNFTLFCTCPKLTPITVKTASDDGMFCVVFRNVICGESNENSCEQVPDFWPRVTKNLEVWDKPMIGLHCNVVADNQSEASADVWLRVAWPVMSS